MKKRNDIVKLTLAAMFLALAFILPFLTGQIPQIGSMLCPMHIPVLLCGFFCRGIYQCGAGNCAADYFDTIVGYSIGKTKRKIKRNINCRGGMTPGSLCFQKLVITKQNLH